MSFNNYNDMTEAQYDVLKEIGNIGSGNATTALSEMLNCKISMRIPDVKLIDIRCLADLVGGAENLVVAVMLTCEGDISGMMLFVMEEASAKKIASLILQQSCRKDDFNEMELSALMEIGNIIAGAYMSSISTITGLTILSSVPDISHDMAGAVLSVPAIELGKLGDKALMIESNFEQTEDMVDGFFLLVPDMESYNVIMSRVGM